MRFIHVQGMPGRRRSSEQKEHPLGFGVWDRFFPSFSSWMAEGDSDPVKSKSFQGSFQRCFPGDPAPGASKMGISSCSSQPREPGHSLRGETEARGNPSFPKFHFPLFKEIPGSPHVPGRGKSQGMEEPQMIPTGIKPPEPPAPLIPGFRLSLNFSARMEDLPCCSWGEFSVFFHSRPDPSHSQFPALLQDPVFPPLPALPSSREKRAMLGGLFLPTNRFYGNSIPLGKTQREFPPRNSDSAGGTREWERGEKAPKVSLNSGNFRSRSSQRSRRDGVGFGNGHSRFLALDWNGMGKVWDSRGLDCLGTGGAESRSFECSQTSFSCREFQGKPGKRRVPPGLLSPRLFRE